MSPEKQLPHLSATGERAAARREERLAAALRANLSRRKAQARARDAAAEPEPLLPPEPPPERA
jgi:hypothetical protein